jgi:large subunit ribosomal protein LP2
MRYVAAALLSALGGGAITEASLKHVLDSVGIEYDAEKAKKVVSELAGKDLEALIAEVSKKLATMLSGGGGGAAAPAAAAGAPAAAAKEEKKVESEKEESDDDMGFGLFD